jgi:hypothetical protein
MPTYTRKQDVVRQNRRDKPEVCASLPTRPVVGPSWHQPTSSSVIPPQAPLTDTIATLQVASNSPRATDFVLDQSHTLDTTAQGCLLFSKTLRLQVRLCSPPSWICAHTPPRLTSPLRLALPSPRLLTVCAAYIRSMGDARPLGDAWVGTTTTLFTTHDTASELARVRDSQPLPRNSYRPPLSV